MPIFTYGCPVCDFRFDRLELTPDPTLPICPRCETEHGHVMEMPKVPTSAAVQFRGEGWCRPSSYHRPVRGSDL